MDGSKVHSGTAAPPMSRKHAGPWNTSVTKPVVTSIVPHMHVLWSCVHNVVPAWSKASCLVSTPVALILVAVAELALIMAATSATSYNGAVGLAGAPSTDASPRNSAPFLEKAMSPKPTRTLSPSKLIVYWSRLLNVGKPSPPAAGESKATR